MSSVLANKQRLTNLQLSIVLLLPVCLLGILSSLYFPTEQVEVHDPDEEQCFRTCRIQIVETIPVNLTFGNGYIPKSTYYAWHRLLKNAQKEVMISAYKTSLQGRHVLGNLTDKYAFEGNQFYSDLLGAGKDGIDIKIVENYPPKDKGDNADGMILENHKAVRRKSIDLTKMFGSGKMHNKFLLVDNKNFYIGSANLDWRSLNQKMELGVFVENCDCLGQDLRNIFDVYWNLPARQKQPALYNKENPLDIDIEGEASQIYIATSPKMLNGNKRTWDLDAIIEEISNAKDFLDIHVMDYFPLFIYKKPQQYFPSIDEALRRAILRGVKVRILAAALHYPEIGIRFLLSLQSLNHLNPNSSIDIKIFKVPTIALENIVISRERRTHNKFMVTESSAVIGTSNWSGDYFVGGTTGAAIVIKQNGHRRTMVKTLEKIFERDWNSIYSHPLMDYYTNCIENQIASYCETKKDPSLFVKPPS